MSSPQLYAIVYGSPGYIQTQTLSHNQTADDVSASFAACPMPTRHLLNALPQDRHYPRASDIPMKTGSDAISFADWTEAQGFARAHQAGTLFNQPALKRPTITKAGAPAPAYRLFV